MSLETFEPVRDTYLNSAIPNGNYRFAPTLRVGRDPVTMLYRSLIQFDVGAVPRGSNVNLAILTMHVARDDYPAARRTIEVRPVNSDWRSSRATWDSQPPRGQPVARAFIPGRQVSRVEFDITTTVSSWVNGVVKNRGICLMQADETLPKSAIQFHSVNAARSGLHPTLAVEFTEAAAAEYETLEEEDAVPDTRPQPAEEETPPSAGDQVLQLIHMGAGVNWSFQVGSSDTVPNLVFSGPRKTLAISAGNSAKDLRPVARIVYDPRRHKRSAALKLVFRPDDY